MASPDATKTTYTHEERNFANEVQRLREERGWTLADIAERFQERDLSYASSMTISRIEKLQRPVRMIEAQAYSEIFEVPTYALANPDRRDAILYLARDEQRETPQKLEALSRAIEDVLSAQMKASVHLDMIREIYSADDLHQESLAWAASIMRTLEQVSTIDIQSIFYRHISAAGNAERHLGGDDVKHSEKA